MNNKGFSLIELMTTVAIIAILTMIAVPSYKTFQARARQKEGFNLLSTFYTAAQSTRTAFGVFPGNFVATGFAPVGTLNYRLQSNDGTDLPGANAFNNDNACTDTSQACDCGGNCGAFQTWAEMNPVGGLGGPIGPYAPTTTVCAMGAITTTDTTFRVGVGGVVSTEAAAGDIYYMNELKAIEMCSDGLK